jgi:hypothetical protein
MSTTDLNPFSLAHTCTARGTVARRPADARWALVLAAPATALLQLWAPDQLTFSLDGYAHGMAGGDFGLVQTQHHAITPKVAQGALPSAVQSLLEQMATDTITAQTEGGPWGMAEISAVGPGWLRVALPAGVTGADELRLVGHDGPASFRWRLADPVGDLATVWLQIDDPTDAGTYWQLTAPTAHEAHLSLQLNFGATLHHVDAQPASAYAWQAAQAALLATILAPIRALGWSLSGLPPALPGPVTGQGGRATRALLRSTHPAALFAGGLRSATAAATESGLRPDLVSEGALACAEHLSAGGVPLAALDLCLLAFDDVHTGPWSGAALARALQVQTAGYPALERWTTSLRHAIHTAADVPAAVRFLERTRHIWQLTSALRVPPTGGVPCTLDGQPVRPETVHRAVAEFNARRFAARGDTPERLNSQWLDPNEVAAFLAALIELPEDIRTEAARHPIELSEPGLKLYAFDGFGLHALASGFALQRGEAGWSVAPAAHHADLGAELSEALDLQQRWERATGSADLSAGDAARAAGHGARLALAATRRTRQAMQTALWNTVPVQGQALDDAALAGLEAQLAQAVSKAPPTSMLPTSRGPIYRYPPKDAPEGQPSEAPGVAQRTAQRPKTRPAPQTRVTAQAPQPSPGDPFGQPSPGDPFGAPTPAPKLPSSAPPLPPGHLHTVELGQAPRGDARRPLVRLVLGPSGLEAIALAPGGDRLVADALAHGVPDLSGRKAIHATDHPLAFLALLPEVFRGRYYASPVTPLPEPLARQSWDHSRPMPELVIEQTLPFQRVLDVYFARPSLTIGINTPADLQLPGDDAGPQQIILSWRDGWLWIAPPQAPVGDRATPTFRLNGMPVAAVDPQRPIPVHPDAELSLGERTLRLRWR